MSPTAALSRIAEHYGSIVPQIGSTVFFLHQGFPHKGLLTDIECTERAVRATFENLRVTRDGGRNWTPCQYGSIEKVFFFSSYEDLLEHYDASDRSPSSLFVS